MISFKLAAIDPHRLCSLALLNVTGGGFQCFPKVDEQLLSLAFRFLRAKNPEERALVDLETHYTKEYLEETVGSCTRRMVLHQPQEIGIAGHQTDEENPATLSERVSQEMFEGIIHEVVEKTGVPAISLILSSLEFLAEK